MALTIGDKVRLLHGREEGNIVSISAGNIVEVEIEEGFLLPVHASEVVKIADHELTYFKPEAKSASPTTSGSGMKTKPLAETGIYLSFLPINNERIVLYISNNTDWTLSYVLTNEKNGQTFGLLGGSLAPKETAKSLTEFKLSQFEDWGSFQFQTLFFREGAMPIKPLFEHKLRCRANSFFSKKQAIPLINESGYVFQLDAKPVAQVDLTTLSAQKLKDAMLSKNVEEVSAISSVEQVIDLHIEKITPAGVTIPQNECLGFQLNHFMKCLEAGLAKGLDTMTFIHGVGNGVLKQEIQRKLTKHSSVAWFKDAQKEKFGYGATLIKFK
ncbi:MAG: Smr/MutS family protein [Spirosomataceae bacterium]